MKINKIRKEVKLFCTILFCAILVVSTSCENFLEEDDVPRLTNDYYKTKQGILSGIDATYSYMRKQVGSEMTNVLTELGTDLMTGAAGTLSYPYNLYSATLSASDSKIYAFWENCYRAISVTNQVLAALPNVELEKGEYELYSAELKFLRSFYYFDLVQHFGRIPLVLEAVSEPKTDFKRASVADVYKQIITDLRYAVEHLRETASGDEHGKATKYSAAHLLAKVYLTRGSAVNDERGQQATDMDSTFYYAKQVVIDNHKYELVDNFADLWDFYNQGNSEIIFSVQFTQDKIYNAEGNLAHLYWCSVYDDIPGMQRDVANGRPYKFHRPTNKTMFELYDRQNDSRFYKSFKWVFYCNKPTNTLALGDTAIYYSLNPKKNREYKYTYFQWNKENPNDDNLHYPHLIKYMDPEREEKNTTQGSREWVRMRLGETYLIAAEAAGRKGDYATAADLINVIRQRAAWKDGETKIAQYWLEEGGAMNDTKSTYDKIKVTASDLQNNFVDFILDERGRELLGEYNRWEDLVRCEKLIEYVRKWNPDAKDNIQEYHKLRPIPQKHIDRLNPRRDDSEEQNPGYF